MAFDLSEVLKDVSGPDTGRDELRYLPYASLLPDIDNGYSMDGIEELARSIELVGLQQPLRVREVKDGGIVYMLISGHRRHAAISLIFKRNPDAFPEGIPCIIDRRDGSPALQELKLLLGNADNRKLTPADEAQQLERMSDCIRRLEAEGWKFPGRHREWLSKMSGMSKSKIGRLEAIQKHLSTSWLKLFSTGKLPESVAYAIQQIPEKYQELLYVLCLEAKPKQQPSALTEYTAKSFAESVSHAESMVCTLDGGAPCIWKEQLIRAGNPRPGWVVHYGRCSAYNRCSACCSTCDRLAVCESVCPKLREKAQTLSAEKKAKDEAKEAESAARREQNRKESAERHRKEREAIDGMWRRLGARRRELGLDVPTAYSMEEPDDEDLAYIVEIESNGGADEDPLSFFDIWEPEAICALADRLQCSLDYLYGRSDPPQPVSNPGTPPAAPPARDLEAATYFRPDGKLSIDGIYTALDWQTGQPLDDGRYLCLVDMNTGKLHEQRCEYRDGQWLAYGQPIHELFSVAAWWPLPPETLWMPKHEPEDNPEEDDDT